MRPNSSSAKATHRSYNAVPDERGKPDVEVEYWLDEEGFAGPRAASPPAIDVLDETTLPAELDLRAGHPVHSGALTGTCRRDLLC
jgi:hypothetical protein